MQLYVLATALGHVLLAMAVGAHAEVNGRRPWRWVPLVLLGGVVGLLWYVARAPGNTRAPDDTERTTPDGPADRWGSSGAALSDPAKAPDEPPEWLDDRPRSKRLADPNSLHVDLPDGTVLTSDDQEAVSAAVEYLEDTPDADAADVCEDVFPDARAGYEYADVWWTEVVHPALEGLPEVEPPPGADRQRVSIDVRELERRDGRRRFEATDGERSAEFVLVDGTVTAASGEEIGRTSPGWMRLAYDAVEEWRDRRVTGA